MNVLKVPNHTIAIFVLPCLLLFAGIVLVPIGVSVYTRSEERRVGKECRL